MGITSACFQANGMRSCFKDILKITVNGRLNSGKSLRILVGQPSYPHELELFETKRAALISSGLNSGKFILAVVRLANAGQLSSFAVNTL